MPASIPIELIPGEFTVCKVKDFSKVLFNEEFTFASKTDAENSLVCRTSSTPSNAFEVEEGWSMLRVAGQLDFSLIGILAKISRALAERRISMFAISTYDTDYVMVKSDRLEEAMDALN